MFPKILFVILVPQYPYTVPADICKTQGAEMLSHASGDAAYSTQVCALASHLCVPGTNYFYRDLAPQIYSVKGFRF